MGPNLWGQPGKYRIGPALALRCLVPALAPRCSVPALALRCLVPHRSIAWGRSSVWCGASTPLMYGPKKLSKTPFGDALPL